MYFTKIDQTLYPAAWQYNCCKIMTELAKIVENNNGHVKYNSYNDGFIVNRTRLEAINKEKENLERWEKYGKEHNRDCSHAILATKAKIEELEKEDNTPVHVTHGTYINFYIGNIYYSLSFDENPFFDFHYMKTPIVNEKYSMDACMDQFTKDWLYDCFFGMASQADILEAANLIYNAAINAPNTRIIRESKRVRVPNYYNSGYHYETVFTPERFAKIDW